MVIINKGNLYPTAITFYQQNLSLAITNKFLEMRRCALEKKIKSCALEKNFPLWPSSLPAEVTQPDQRLAHRIQKRGFAFRGYTAYAECLVHKYA